MAEHRERAREIVDALRGLAPGEVAGFIDRECGDDAELRAAVEHLLGEADRDTAAGPTLHKDADVSTRLDPRPDVPPSLARVGPYRLVRRIGRGGMGEVYLGVTAGTEIKQHVAVKVLRAGQDTEDLLRRFNLERQLLAALNHPNIARLFGAGETTDGRPWYAMEFIEGRPITDYADVHRLHITERLELFQSVCSAIHYAHQNLVVHRDIKPSNILVTEDGTPKLLDFGIAKLLNPQFDLMRDAPTAPELRVMTPEYASPEQVRGGPITTASDVYSLGVLLYELVSGHRPYRIRSRVRAELERIICEEEPDKPSTAVSRVEVLGDDVDDSDATAGGTHTITPESVGKTREVRPEQLRRALAGDIDNIVLMAMRKETQRRYTSAEQLAEDIDRHLHGQPVIACPDTLAYRTSKFIQRNRWGVAAAAAITVLLIGGVVGTTSQWRSATVARDEAITNKVAAETARDRAEVARDEASKYRDVTINFTTDYLDTVYRKVRELEGSMPARQLMVESARQSLESLSSVEDQVALSAFLADMYDRLGQIEGDLGEEHSGRTDASVEHHRQALVLRERIVEDDPKNQGKQRKLAQTLTHLANRLRRVDELDEAKTHYDRAYEIAQRLADQDARHRRFYAVTLFNLGRLQAQTGDVAGSLDRYWRSLEIRQALLDADPGHPMRHNDVRLVCQVIGFHHMERGRLEDAERMLRRAQERATSRCDLSPDSDRARGLLALTHYYCAQNFLLMERSEEARVEAENACRIWEQRDRDNVGNAVVRRDLALCHQLRGEILSAAGDLEGAKTEFEAYRVIADELADGDPTPFNRGRAAEARVLLGQTMADLGDTEAGLAECLGAERELAGIIDAVQADATLADTQAQVLLGLGHVLAAGGRWMEAVPHLRRAEEVYSSLVDDEPGNVLLRSELASTRREQGELALGLNQPDEARDRFLAALAALDGIGLIPAHETLRREIEVELAGLD